jgi:hypothetical protein
MPAVDFETHLIGIATCPASRMTDGGNLGVNAPGFRYSIALVDCQESKAVSGPALCRRANTKA